MRLLVVEDEPDIRAALIKGLQREGYAVDGAATARDALDAIDVTRYDLILLDLNLPDLNGMSLLGTLRDAGDETRILILSAEKDLDTRIRGLDLGANDYLVKPFDFSELCARIRALLRRDFTHLPPVLAAGRLTLDRTTRRVRYDGAEIVLTRKEFEILSYLIQHPDRTISAEELMEHVWDENADPFSQVIRVHIYSLRRKLTQATGGPEPIETVKGVGYRLRDGVRDVHVRREGPADGKEVRR